MCFQKYLKKSSEPYKNIFRDFIKSNIILPRNRGSTTFENKLKTC